MFNEPSRRTRAPRLRRASPGGPSPTSNGKVLFSRRRTKLQLREAGTQGTGEINSTSVMSSCLGAARASPPSTPHQVFAADNCCCCCSLGQQHHQGFVPRAMANRDATEQQWSWSRGAPCSREAVAGAPRPKGENKPPNPIRPAQCTEQRCWESTAHPAAHQRLGSLAEPHGTLPLGTLRSFPGTLELQWLLAVVSKTLRVAVCFRWWLLEGDGAQHPG